MDTVFFSGKCIKAKEKSDFDQITQVLRVSDYDVIVAQFVENFASFYGIRNFVTCSFLTQTHSVRYLPLYSFQVCINIILISMPRLSKLSFTLRIYQQVVYLCSLSFLRAALSARQTLVYLVTLIMFGTDYSRKA